MRWGPFQQKSRDTFHKPLKTKTESQKYTITPSIDTLQPGSIWLSQVTISFTLGAWEAGGAVQCPSAAGGAVFISSIYCNTAVRESRSCDRIHSHSCCHHIRGHPHSQNLPFALGAWYSDQQRHWYTSPPQPSHSRFASATM